jgi:hypothetical protein
MIIRRLVTLDDPKLFSAVDVPDRRLGGQLLSVSLQVDGWVRLTIPWSIHGGCSGRSQNGERWRRTLQRRSRSRYRKRS